MPGVRGRYKHRRPWLAMRFGIGSDEEERQLRASAREVASQVRRRRQELLDAGFTDECLDCGGSHLWPGPGRCPDCGARRRMADGRWA
jgi:rubrerythrin